MLIYRGLKAIAFCIIFTCHATVMVDLLIKDELEGAQDFRRSLAVKEVGECFELGEGITIIVDTLFETQDKAIIQMSLFKNNELMAQPIIAMNPSEAAMLRIGKKIGEKESFFSLSCVYKPTYVQQGAIAQALEIAKKAFGKVGLVNAIQSFENSLGNHIADEAAEYLLHFAVYKADVAAVKFLLARDIDVNRWNFFGYPVLHQAVGNTNMFKLLLDHPGIDVNVRDKYGYTALHHALWSRRFDVVELLLQDGRCDLSASRDVNDWSWPLLHFAIWSTNGLCDEVVHLLQTSSFDPACVDSLGQTAVHFAVSLSKESALRCLLQSGLFDINAQDNFGCTPLHTAVVNFCSPGTLQLLLAAGADPDAFDGRGVSARTWAELLNNQVALKVFSS